MMASQTSPHSEVGSRYANALYDLASETQVLDVVEGDLKGLASTISGSKELQSVIENPVFSRDDKFNAITALLKQGNANVLVQKCRWVDGQEWPAQCVAGHDCRVSTAGSGCPRRSFRHRDFRHPR